jgi:hypothetical protein
MARRARALRALATTMMTAAACGGAPLDDASWPRPTATVGVLGDLIFQGRIQHQSFAADDGARSLLADVVGLIAAPDVTYGNFEGVASCCRDAEGSPRVDPGHRFDGEVYSSLSSRGLNTSPELVVDLAAAGIDVMSTANNHALDRGRFGVLATLDAMDAAGVSSTGTRRAAGEPWHTVVQANGLAIAFVACTAWTNGPEDDRDTGPEDDRETVLYCFRDEDELVGLVASLFDDALVDAVIVTPHAGVGEQDGPDRRYRAFARRLAEAGATAVLGNGRHVVQDWERHGTADGRSVLLVYSIGNVFADKREAVSRTSVFLHLTLARHEIVAVRWAPLVFPDLPDGSLAPRSVVVAEPAAGLVPLPRTHRIPP